MMMGHNRVVRPQISLFVVIFAYRLVRRELLDMSYVLFLIQKC